METFYSRFKVHGALEGENGARARVPGAEILNGRRGECAACTVGEDEHGGGGRGWREWLVVVACDGILDGVVGYAEGCERLRLMRIPFIFNRF